MHLNNLHIETNFNCKMNESTKVEAQAIPKINLDLPRWDQSKFSGRLRHFIPITALQKCFLSSYQLEEAKQLVESYRSGNFHSNITEEQLWKAKAIYDSAFHPDTGEKMHVIGRMSFQMISGMTILGMMMQYYKTPLQVTLMQCVNQSFVSFVNYTNRNAASPTSKKQAIFACSMATSSAVVVAVSLNIYARRASSLVARLVPFVAVVAANFVNVPLTRRRELEDGIIVTTDDGEVLGKSQRCAMKGILQVITTRVSTSAPAMILLPFLMEHLNKRAWFRRMPWLHLPLQVTGIGLIFCATVPMGCALFPQKASMPVSNLEQDLQSSIKEQYGGRVKKVYFNKGL